MMMTLSSLIVCEAVSYDRSNSKNMWNNQAPKIHLVNHAKNVHFYWINVLLFHQVHPQEFPCSLFSGPCA